jgi:hypothetical protein
MSFLGSGSRQAKMQKEENLHLLARRRAAS